MERKRPQRTPPNQVIAADAADPLKEYRVSIVMPPGHEGAVVQLTWWSLEHRGEPGNHVLRGVTLKGGKPLLAVGDLTNEIESDPAAGVDDRIGLVLTLRRIWVDGHRIV